MSKSVVPSISTWQFNSSPSATRCHLATSGDSGSRQTLYTSELGVSHRKTEWTQSASSSGDEKLVDKSHSVECDTKGDEDLVDKIQSVDCETMDLGRQRCRVRHDESSSERTAVRGLRKMYWWRRWRRRGVISQRKQCALDNGHEIMCSDSDVASLLQTPIFTHTENEKNMKMVKKDETLPTCFFFFQNRYVSTILGDRNANIAMYQVYPIALFLSPYFFDQSVT